MQSTPPITFRLSDITKKKLGPYKTEGMTWPDLALEGLKYKEMGIDKENVISLLQEIIEETIEEKIKRAEEEILEKTKKMAYDVVVHEIKKELEKARKQNEEHHSELLEKVKVFFDLQDEVRFNVRTIKKFIKTRFPDWTSFFKVEAFMEGRDEHGERIETH